MVFLGILVYSTTGWATDASDVTISPASLKIGILFSGCEVSIAGSVLSGRDVVIEIIGPEQNGAFKIKDKIGPFWMNRRKVEIKQAPFFYGLLLPQNNPFVADLPIPGTGIANLKKHIFIRSDELPRDSVFDLFVQLKRSEKLYVGPFSSIRYSEGSEGRRRFSAEFHLPASIAPGEYKVMTSIIHDGRLENKLAGHIQVQETGIVQGIYELAYRHSLIYGILAVIIALLVGTVMGVVFKGGQSH
jgi:hypothetical protein